VALRDAAAARELQRRLARMSPAEYRQYLMDTDPERAAGVRQREARNEAAAEAEPQKMEDQLADDGEPEA
jgi:hypothetical protein